MGRSSRKDEILQAALACFSEHGVDATTIEMIRDRSGASIGSLYHHFGNKERIHGELYLAGIGSPRRARSRSPAAPRKRSGCWSPATSTVVANPDWARFILHSRGRVEAGSWASACGRQPGPLRADPCGAGGISGRGPVPRDAGRLLCFGGDRPGPRPSRQWLAGRTRGVGRLSRTAGAGGLGQRAGGLRRPWFGNEKPAAAGFSSGLPAAAEQRQRLLHRGLVEVV